MGKIVLDKEKCKSCGLCVLACPKKLLEIGDNFNSKGIAAVEFRDNGSCSGCSMCAKSCPDLAITGVYR